MVEMAIVAIPDDRDPVWKISSVKIPHMTLLYLGDQNADERVAHISEYVEHATKTSIGRFGLSVDHRGPLGPDPADVLFFDKNWTAKKLTDFRATLLKDPAIFGMYNSVEQFPEWTPHLTLGYPDAPANEENEENRIPYWIEFNRIAFWFDDFEGVDYLIPNDNLLGEAEVAWSDSNLSDFLSHHGISHAEFTKEQRDKLAEKDEALPDGSYPIRNVSDLENAIKAYGRAKNKEKVKAWIKKRAKALEAESYLPEEWMTDSVEQSDPVDDFLSHYGVKGMKWGRRKEDNDGLEPGVVVTRQEKPGSKITAKGGGGKYASTDAEKAARNLQVAKKSGTQALTNRELQEVVTRMNLEQQYQRLTSQNKKELFRGENFVKDVIKTGKTVNDALNTYSTVQKNLGPLMDIAAKR